MVLTADGAEATATEAYWVWVHLRSLADGHWAGFGKILTLPEPASYVDLGPTRQVARPNGSARPRSLAGLGRCQQRITASRTRGHRAPGRSGPGQT